MRPKSSSSDQRDLARSRLDQILNRRHPLFRLADSIDWKVFEKEFGPHVQRNPCRMRLQPEEFWRVILLFLFKE